MAAFESPDLEPERPALGVSGMAGMGRKADGLLTGPGASSLLAGHQGRTVVRSNHPVPYNFVVKNPSCRMARRIGS